MYFEDTFGTTELSSKLYYCSDDLKALAEMVNDIRIEGLPSPSCQNMKEKLDRLDAQLRIVLMGMYTIVDSLQKQADILQNEGEA